MATKFWDTQLFAKLSSGDMTAINAVYYKQYLTAFYNKNCTVVREDDQKEYIDLTSESITFDELVSYIEENDKKNSTLITFLNCQTLYDSTYHNFSNLIAICQSVQTQLF